MSADFTSLEELRKDHERLNKLIALAEQDHASLPSFEDGMWGINYIIYGDDGFGSGVGRHTFRSLRDALDLITETPPK